uniref:Uncharacterized protein n=1 Tax=Rhizophagus irregularis (strain DAOM 181602 / DAOM 197198 / MUCL 43194) TaxID=747089 RepID=U9TCN4_RHIID
MTLGHLPTLVSGTLSHDITVLKTVTQIIYVDMNQQPLGRLLLVAVGDPVNENQLDAFGCAVATIK